VNVIAGTLHAHVLLFFSSKRARRETAKISRDSSQSYPHD